MLTGTGKQPPVEPNEVVYVVGCSLGAVTRGALKDFATARARQSIAEFQRVTSSFERTP